MPHLISRVINEQLEDDKFLVTGIIHVESDNKSAKMFEVKETVTIKEHPIVYNRMIKRVEEETSAIKKEMEARLKKDRQIVSKALPLEEINPRAQSIINKTFKKIVKLEEGF